MDNLKSKVHALQKQEDDFNANVQVIIESDEAQLKLTEKINENKAKLEQTMSELDSI